MKNLRRHLHKTVYSLRSSGEMISDNAAFWWDLQRLQFRKKVSYSPKILVLYFIPFATYKSQHWVDGFTSAIKVLRGRFNITMFNIRSRLPSVKEMNCFDLILVKSNWNWGPDKLLRKARLKLKAKKVLMISGVAPPPPPEDMLFYDVLFYETEWYRPQIEHHPEKLHAFGVNVDIMKPDATIPKRYDWMTVGSIVGYKRPDKLLMKEGKKVAVGDLKGSDKTIIELLRRSGVEVLDFVHYEELAHLYNLSRNVYIPATIKGGGERAVLEARACGVPVFVENDNPKLMQLLSSDVWDHHYYANQLEKGIWRAVEGK